MQKFLLLLAVAAGLHGQAAATAFLPSYYVGTGASYDYYGGTGFAAHTTVGIRMSPTSKLYSFSTIDFTPKQATLRTGAAYALFQSGYWSMLALGDAGLATGTGATLGSFTGGGFLMYDAGGALSKGSSHFYVSVGGRVLNITSQTVQPVFEVTFGKGF